MLYRSRNHFTSFNALTNALRSHSLILAVALFFSAFNSHAEQSANEADKADATKQEERAALAYKGWAAIRRDTFDENAAEDDWIYMKEINILDNGQTVKILDEGKETGYSVQLAVLTYEKTQTTVLKLGLIEDSSGKTKTYIWGEPGAQRLGMNLRWMQTGFTRVDGAETE